MKSLYICLVTISFTIFLNACNNKISYTPLNVISQQQYDTLLYNIAPYTNKRPDHVAFENRFDKEHKAFYANKVEVQLSEIRYLHKTDSAYCFLLVNKDITSLYEHYRAFGGYLKMDELANISYINILFHTPRLTKEEMTERGKLLFETMVNKGNVTEYIGNRDYIHTPNDDFYYDDKENRWNHTPNSSWKFLEEVKGQ